MKGKTCLIAEEIQYAHSPGCCTSSAMESTIPLQRGDITINDVLVKPQSVCPPASEDNPEALASGFTC